MLGSPQSYLLIALCSLVVATSSSFALDEESNSEPKDESPETIVQNLPEATVGKEDEVSSKQSSTTTNTLEASIDATPKKLAAPKFSALLDVTVQTDGSQFSNEEKGLSATNWLFLNYQISSLYKARLWISYAKDLANSYEDTLNNTRLTFSREALKLTDKLTLRPSVNLLLPTSEVARRSQKLNLGLELGTSFGYKFNSKFGVSYFARAGKNFHEFRTTTDNNVNVEYTLLQIFSASYSISEKVYFAPALIYNNGWSYFGTQRDPAFTTWFELGYVVNKDLTLALGASNGGTLENRQNGPDQTIEILDKETTNYFAKFALRF